MKRILSLVLALVLLSGILPAGDLSASAAVHETVEKEYALPQELNSQEAAGEETSAQEEFQKTPENYLLGEQPEDDGKEAPATRSVSSGTCGDNLAWTLDTDTRTLTISGTGAMTDYSSSAPAPWYSKRSYISSVVIEEGLTNMGDSAFRNCSNLTSVSLPSTVIEIGMLSFQSCTSLESITLPEGLILLNYGAFNDCSALKSIHLPSTVSIIWMYAFFGCTALTDISVAEGNENYIIQDGCLYNADATRLFLCPADLTGHLVILDTVTDLTEEALAHCTQLEAVTIPDGMEWNPNAFTFCKGMQNYYVYESNPNYASVEGVLFNKAKDTLVLFPAGRTGHYDIPEGTVTVGYAAFCRMENPITIAMPDSVTVIEGSAFSYSPGMTQLTLSSKLEEIYAHAFTGCKSMGNVTLPDTLTLLGYDSFNGCETITEIAIPKGINVISNETFRDCTKLKKVVFPDTLTTIGSQAFMYCYQLETVNFPEGLTSVGSYAFYLCQKLQGLDLPSTLTSIGREAFCGCDSITKVAIPQGVEEIPYGVFSGCDSLASVILPKGLQTINTVAFYNAAIDHIVIPESVTKIEDSAFSSCKQLTSVHFLGDAPAASSKAFNSASKELVLYYTEGAAGWTSPTWNDLPTALWSYDYSTTANCTDGGVETFRCKDCDLSYERNVLAYGHTYGQWSLGLAPTQSAEGFWQRVCTACGYVHKESIPAVTLGEQAPTVTNNFGDQNYSVWSSTVKSYLINNSDGTLTRVESDGTEVSVERYSADFEFVSRQVLPMELPIFGGFYEGKDYFFLVFGQTNPDEDDSTEVVRVVRYTKDWYRMGHASLYGANTYIPFDAGSLRMTQCKDMLYVHTSHEMYASSDGLHHQANMIFSIHIPEMEITDQYTDVMNVSYGYVSHSFNQFVLTDGDRLLTLNHGDAYPRSAVIVQYGKPAGQAEFTGSCTAASILTFTGSTGYNATGASLGAFERSDTALLTAGNSILQDGSVDFYGQRNIFLAVTPLGDIGTTDTTLRWITNYADGADISVSTPHLLRIHDNYFILLWTENGALRYVFVDELGNTVSRIYEANMPLSDCKPIVFNGKVCWYVTQNTQPAFFTISIDDPEKVQIYSPPVVLTLDPNGGTLESTTFEVSYGQPYGQLPVPTRKTAYKFLGWYTMKQYYSNQDYSAYQIAEDMIVDSLQGQTLYAHWQRQDHTCEYEVVEVIPANCTSGEITRYECKYCDSGYRSYDYNYQHTWNEGSITTAPTCTQTGVRTFQCALCEETKTESVPATGHTYTETVTAPTCTEQGYTTHTCHCGNQYITDYEDAAGHQYKNGVCVVCNTPESSEKITITFATPANMQNITVEKGEEYTLPECTESYDGYYFACWVTKPCVNVERFDLDDEYYPGDKLTGEEDMVFFALYLCLTQVTLDPPGYYWMGSTGTGNVANTNYSGEVILCGFPYDAAEGIYDLNKPYALGASGETVNVLDNANASVRTNNLRVYTDDETLGYAFQRLNDGSYTIFSIDSETYLSVSDGALTYLTTPDSGSYWKISGEKRGSEQIHNVAEPNLALLFDHDSQCFGLFDASAADKNENYKIWMMLKMEITYLCTTRIDTGKPCEHEITELCNVKEATCTQEGYTGDVCCMLCGEIISTGDVIPTGHSYEAVVTGPTCTQQGYTVYTCHCGDSYTDSYVAALGHAWDEGTMITEPTETEPGEMRYICARCAETKTESVPATGANSNAPCDGGANCPSRIFTDVDTSQWYHAGIDFALNNSLFNGMSETTFEPDTAMTRAMLVTVLWRYAGSPDEGTSDFTDVKGDAWYAKAVAWAAKNGVVTGIGEGKFDPEGKVTREQMAAILYRYSNSLGLDTSKGAELTSFPDGGKTSGYATEALSWAVAEGLVTGTKIGSTTYLDPQGSATRAQVATILMRYIENVTE